MVITFVHVQKMFVKSSHAESDCNSLQIDMYICTLYIHDCIHVHVITISPLLSKQRSGQWYRLAFNLSLPWSTLSCINTD